MRFNSIQSWLSLVLALIVLHPHRIVAEEPAPEPAPLRLDRLLGLPPWLHLFFTQRTRFESLQNQFRPVDSVDDRALSLRTTLLAEFKIKPIAVGLELADSRLYLEDSDTPLNNALINPLDFLQAYVTVWVPNAFSRQSSLRIRAGRQTLDLGSRRFVARNRFRNTINSFTGIDLEWTSAKHDTARAFATVPVQRRPTLFDALDGNDVEFDTELTSNIFWGLFYGSRAWSGSLRAEAYVLGLHEEDDDVRTRNRNIVTPGFRILRARKAGQLDFEIETAYQAGTSRRTFQPEDTTDLRHRAYFFHGALGHTFSGAWSPRLALLYDYASGDRNPDDLGNQKFFTLYGARRFEFGPTGIYGALGRSNINSPSLRLEIRPNARLLSFVAYRPAWLAEARDFWSTTGIWDPDGNSGTFLGHQFEGAARWQILPGNLMLEAGLAYLRLGEFPRQAPNGDPNAGDPLYFYAQFGFQF